MFFFASGHRNTKNVRPMRSIRHGCLFSAVFNNRGDAGDAGDVG